VRQRFTTAGGEWSYRNENTSCAAPLADTASLSGSHISRAALRLWTVCSRANPAFSTTSWPVSVSTLNLGDARLTRSLSAFIQRERQLSMFVASHFSASLAKHVELPASAYTSVTSTSVPLSFGSAYVCRALCCHIFLHKNLSSIMNTWYTALRPEGTERPVSFLLRCVQEVHRCCSRTVYAQTL